jgi:hypothetical protein
LPWGGEPRGFRRFVVTIRLAAALSGAVLAGTVPAGAQTPLAGHYPPGQSGLRGGASPLPGWSVTNFNRFFSNIEAKDADGEAFRRVDELRFANITMITATSNVKVLGLTYGAMMGIPFSTGNLNPSADDLSSKAFGLGDILVTPIALYHRSPEWDWTVQFTWWSDSGNFEPGGTKNRSTGFESLVYSLGAAWYPGMDRSDWSLSAISRLEQNFEQKDTGIRPGDDLVIDWGVGKGVAGPWRAEMGVSGFATWQISEQEGGDPDLDTTLYRYYGAGPEVSVMPGQGWTLRLRLQWEFGAVNAVQGNNAWFILNKAF